MPPREPPPLLGTSHFRVLIGRREVGFAEVGPLCSHTEPAQPGGAPAHTLQPVVLRRALTGSTDLYEWRRRIVGGRNDRRAVTIHQLDGADGAIVNSWRLEDAWPCRWSGPSFAASGTAVATEEIELAYRDLV
jgi:hypothetical protein